MAEASREADRFYGYVRPMPLLARQTKTTPSTTFLKQCGNLLENGCSGACQANTGAFSGP
jgi:hypothetical protein